MLAQMSQRERMIAIGLGSVIALFINVILIRFFLKHHDTQKYNIAQTQAKIDNLKRLEPERAKWEARKRHIDATMPVLGEIDVANRQLSEMIKEVAKKHNLIINQPNPGVANKASYYTALGLKIDVKGAWPQLRDFLNELQTPGQYIVLDPVEIKVDPTDKTQHHVSVTVTKWFAPS
jgi:Tfp pilus assembly protein PilO